MRKGKDPLRIVGFPVFRRNWKNSEEFDTKVKRAKDLAISEYDMVGGNPAKQESDMPI